MSHEYQSTATEQVETIGLIGQEAIAIVDATYGSGYPHYHSGQNELAYHNGHHTRSVKRDGARMAEALGLSVLEQSIVQSAASAHDIDQEGERGVMERKSAEWFVEKMIAKGIDRTKATAGSLAILGTEPRFNVTPEGLLITQVYNELEYPSKVAAKIARSVATGDLAELHAPTGPRVAHDLYLEIHGLAPNAEPPIDEAFLKFQASQAFLASEFKYADQEEANPIADRLFGGLRGAVVDYSESLTDAIVRGDIETWQQIIKADETFIRQYS